MKVDWKRLTNIHNTLLQENRLQPETDITFILILNNSKPKKSIVKFKDFLKFLWQLSESKKLEVQNLIAQDPEGRVLYRFKRRNACNEEIPDGGNNHIIQNWNNLNETQKSVYLKLLISQLQAYV